MMGMNPHLEPACTKLEKGQRGYGGALTTTSIMYARNHKSKSIKNINLKSHTGGTAICR